MLEEPEEGELVKGSGFRLWRLGSPTRELCGLGEVTKLLRASVSPSVKRGGKQCLLPQLSLESPQLTHTEARGTGPGKRRAPGTDQTAGELTRRWVGRRTAWPSCRACLKPERPHAPATGPGGARNSTEGNN